MSLEHDRLNDGNWAYIQGLGLRADIRTREDYLREVDAGLDRARNLLHRLPEHSWSTLGLKSVHRQILRTAYAPESKVAGEYTREQLVLYGPGKAFVAGALPSKIGPTLENLCKVLRDTFRTATTEAEKIRAAIEFHVNFKAVQGFPDANGRTASVFLDRHLSIALKEDILLTMDNYAYRSGMWPAVEKGVFGPLEETIRDAIQRCRIEKGDDRRIWTDAEVADALMLTTEVNLTKVELARLPDRAVKDLLSNPQISRINGLTRQSLQEEFRQRGGDEHAGVQDVKKLIFEALEQDSRHSDSVHLIQQPSQLNTRELKQRL